MEIISFSTCRICLGETNCTVVGSIWTETDSSEFKTISEKIAAIADVKPIIRSEVTVRQQQRKKTPIAFGSEQRQSRGELQLGSQIESDDGLSQIICDECYNLVDQFLDFKILCEKNEKIQRKLVGPFFSEPASNSLLNFPDLTVDYEATLIIPLKLSMVDNSVEYLETEDIHESLIKTEDSIDSTYDEQPAEPEVVWLAKEEENNNPVECDDCRELFENVDMLNAHIALKECNPELTVMKELPEGKCLCKICGRVVKWIKRHIRLKHPSVFKVVYKKKGKSNLAVQCDSCGVLLHQQRGLKRHKATLKCKIRTAMTGSNGELIENEINLDEHLENVELEANEDPTTDGKKTRKCLICGKLTKSGFLRRHIRLVHPDIYANKYKATQLPKVKCNRCAKWVRNKYLMQFHKCKIATPEEIARRKEATKIRVKARPKRFGQCNVCGKLVCAKLLEAHERTHTGEKPFKCQYCDKMLASKTTLVIHERMHTGENPLVCKVCGKAFYDKSTFKVHEERHSTIYKYSCATCSRTFKTYDHLQYHKPRCQKNARNFHCETCGNDFLLESDLRRHIKIHTTEKTHVCEFCGYKTMRLSGLNTHMQSHLKEKKYKCDLCPAVLSYKYGLTRHKRILHPEAVAKRNEKEELPCFEFEGSSEINNGVLISYMDS